MGQWINIFCDVNTHKNSELREKISLSTRKRMILELIFFLPKIRSGDHHQLVRNMALECKREF